MFLTFPVRSVPGCGGIVSAGKLDVWAGVVPVLTSFSKPEPDAALRPGIAAPAHVRGGEG